MMANYFLNNKVLGQPKKEVIIPEECDHIFSIPPRCLPGEQTAQNLEFSGHESKLEPYVMTSEDEDEDDGRLTYHRRGRLLICLP
ncbi:BnaC05g51470D [Brassica napus]|uniref:BnaC05g51470D protein n=1 Tax=Brassica napus TaxID=3708 RepID=A0A078GWA8_BRANA|nr:BnaC05g51470D [Brassica napus]